MTTLAITGAGTPVPSNQPNRYYALGLSSGALIMTAFGAVWAFVGVGFLSLPGSAGVLSLIGVGIVAIALFLGCLALLRAARRLPAPKDLTPESKAQAAAIGRRIGISFGIVFGGEIVLIALANIICSLLNHSEFAIPLTVLIVGIHFLPLAALFQVRQYYLTGILLSLLAILTMIATSPTATINQDPIWDVLPGLGCTLLLWLTTVSILVTGHNVVKNIEKAEN